MCIIIGYYGGLLALTVFLTATGNFGEFLDSGGGYLYLFSVLAPIVAKIFVRFFTLSLIVEQNFL